MRDLSVDSLKGLAIGFVVIGHAVIGLQTKNILGNGWDSVVAFIYSFHMPLFFFCSGFFISTQIEKLSSIGFFQSRFWRLIYPLVLWTYIFLGIKFLAGSFQNTPIEFADLLRLPLPPYAHLWFLWALFITHVVFYALSKAGLTNRSSNIVLFVLTAIMTSLSLWGNILPPLLAQGMGHLVFLLFGCLIYTTPQIRSRLDTGCAVAVSGLVFVALEILYLRLLPYPEIKFLCALTGCLFFFALCLFISRQFGNGSIVTRTMSILGTASMAIYLMHTIISAAFREGLVHLGNTDPVLHVLGGSLLGLMGPLAVYIMLPRRSLVTRTLGLS